MDRLKKKYGELWWEGGGCFGEAYSTEDGRIVKITTDKKEFEIAKMLLEEPRESLVKIEEVFELKGSMIIVQEKLNTDFNKYVVGRITEMVNAQGISWSSFHHYFDDEELEGEELKAANEISEICWDLARLGIEAPDIHDDNFGLRGDKLVLFDVTDRMSFV